MKHLGAVIPFQGVGYIADDLEEGQGAFCTSLPGMCEKNKGVKINEHHRNSCKFSREAAKNAKATLKKINDFSLRSFWLRVRFRLLRVCKNH